MNESATPTEVSQLLDLLDDEGRSSTEGGEKFRAEVARVSTEKKTAEAARSGDKPAAKPSKVWPRGTRVIIQNLQSRSDLNGMSGQVVGFVEDKCRYKVRIDADGSSIAVKPENITLRASEPDAGSQKQKERNTGGPVSIPETMREDFEDQQRKLTTAALQLENLEERMTKLMREARRQELTTKAVDAEDESVIMYAQYGRCFVQQDRSKLQLELHVASKKYQAQIKKTKDSQQYYEKQQQETTTNLQEMLQSLQHLQA